MANWNLITARLLSIVLIPVMTVMIMANAVVAVTSVKIMAQEVILAVEGITEIPAQEITVVATAITEAATGITGAATVPAMAAITEIITTVILRKDIKVITRIKSNYTNYKMPDLRVRFFYFI